MTEREQQRAIFMELLAMANTRELNRFVTELLEKCAQRQDSRVDRLEIKNIRHGSN